MKLHTQLALCLTVLGVVGVGLCLASDPQGDEWRRPHYSVYARESRPEEAVPPAKTLENLKALLALMVEWNEPALDGYKARTEELIELSNVSPDKCGSDSLGLFTTLIQRHSIHSINLIPYLKHYRDAQVAACQGYASA